MTLTLQPSMMYCPLVQGLITSVPVQQRLINKDMILSIFILVEHKILLPFLGGRL